MNDKIKKIIAASSLMVAALGAVGCSQSSQKIAKNIDRSMSEFVSCLNNLDLVVPSANASKPAFSKEVANQGGAQSKDKKVGKIVETSASPSGDDTQSEGAADYKITKLIMTQRVPIEYANEGAYSKIFERVVSTPSDRSGFTNLFVLSTTPFITITSGDEELYKKSVELSESIENKSVSIDQKINALILRRSILMIYVNEIYSGNVTLSEENKVAINAYVNVIKENTSFLNGNRGMVKNQLTLADDLNKSGSNNQLIGFYMIKSKEALEVRANKLDSAISAIDSIIDILESSLTDKSPYYNKNLSASYESMANSINSNEIYRGEINKASSNKEVADKILSSLHFKTILKKDSQTLQSNNTSATQTMQKNANSIQNSQKTASNLANNGKNQILEQNNGVNQNASKDTDKSVIITPLNSNNNNNSADKNCKNCKENLASKSATTNGNELIKIDTNSNFEIQNELNRASAGVYESKHSQSKITNIEGEPNTNLIQNRQQNRLTNRDGTNLVDRPQTLELKDGEDRDLEQRKSEDDEYINKTKIHRVKRGAKKKNSNRSNSNMENEKIMRADRNPQKQTFEQYSNTNGNPSSINRVQNMPFRTNNK